MVGLWRHDPRVPKLIGLLAAPVMACLTHDLGFGDSPSTRVLVCKGLMQVLLERLRAMEVEKVTLFADANVVSFYKAQGWDLEPRGERCVFWYAR